MTTTTSAGTSEPFISCEDLVRIYRSDRVEVQALQGLDLEVDAGEFVALVGASGSGKSTLLNILSGNDRPTAGRARVGEQDLLTMTRAQSQEFRRRTAGFVWQQTASNLVPYLTAQQNVALPLLATGTRRRARTARVQELLTMLGVKHCAHRTPAQLSGGEQQRVAIAVSVANRPQVLYADEPTGALDTATSEQVLAAFRQVNRESGITVVLVTHDAVVADSSDRTIAIRDGRTATETVRRTERDSAGVERTVSDEFAVLDRAGRLQLPRAFTDALAMRRRVRLHLEPDHVAVWPHDDPQAQDRSPEAASR